MSNKALCVISKDLLQIVLQFRKISLVRVMQASCVDKLNGFGPYNVVNLTTPKKISEMTFFAIA